MDLAADENPNQCLEVFSGSGKKVDEMIDGSKISDGIGGPATVKKALMKKISTRVENREPYLEIEEVCQVLQNRNIEFK